jgi:hypothetical protein
MKAAMCDANDNLDEAKAGARARIEAFLDAGLRFDLSVNGKIDREQAYEDLYRRFDRPGCAETC